MTTKIYFTASPADRDCVYRLEGADGTVTDWVLLRAGKTASVMMHSRQRIVIEELEERHGEILEDGRFKPADPFHQPKGESNGG